MSVNKAKSIKAVGIGTVAGLAVILLTMCLISGIVMIMPSVPRDILPFAALAGVAAGTFIGGCIAAAITGSKGLITGLINGAAIFICLMLFGMITGPFEPGVMTIIRLVITAVFSALGGIKGVNRKEKLHIR